MCVCVSVCLSVCLSVVERVVAWSATPSENRWDVETEQCLPSAFVGMGGGE